MVSKSRLRLVHKINTSTNIPRTLRIRRRFHLTYSSNSKYFLVVALTAGADSAICVRGFESRKSYESHSRKTKGARCGSFRCFKFVIVVRLHSPAFPCDSSFLPTGGPADA